MTRFFLAAALACIGAAAVPAQVPPMQVLSTEEFLRLPEDRQVLFLSGVLEGISYTNYSRPEYAKWVACVQAETMDTLHKLVRSMIDLDPKARKEPVPWLVVRAIGARVCGKESAYPFKAKKK